jgi:hypothetical protein
LAATNLQLTEPTVYCPCVQELQTLLHGLWSDQFRESNYCLHGAIGPTSLWCTFDTVTLKTQIIFIIHIVEIIELHVKVISTSTLYLEGLEFNLHLKTCYLEALMAFRSAYFIVTSL